MTLKLLLVDDEPLARLRLKMLLAEIVDPPTRVVAEADNAAQALLRLAALPVDVVLLDIAMPGETGLQMAARLAAAPGSPAVVFVTAHAEHALKAFELDASDYLTKPVRRERLQAALQRVAQRRTRADAPGAGPPLVVSERGRVLRVPLADIVYLRAGLKSVTLRTAGGSHVLDESLAELSPRLGEGFLRIHRNALVARRAVRELAQRPDGRWAVRVAPTDEWLAVSRRQLPALRRSMDGP